MERGLASPWVVSGLLHVGAVAVVLVLALTWLPEPPATMRMRLSGSGAAAASPLERVSSSPPLPGSPVAKAEFVAESSAWQELQEYTLADDFYRALGSFEVGLDEVLMQQPASEPGLSVPPFTGWSNDSRTEGHAFPPLPPAELLPVQGARWNLVFTIPAEGGFPTDIEGLATGMPELDRWLGVWLQDVSFPVSPENSAYRLRWILVLQVGLPE